MKGAFITVEGTDGSGKTTNIDFIEQWLKECGADVVRTREPGGTALGEELREVLLQTDGAPISNRAELLLFFAGRAQHLDEVILPALESGQWILCDRFTDATYAYQGGGRGMSMKDIETLENFIQGTLQPDLTIFLDVPVNVGRARVVQQDMLGLGQQDMPKLATLKDAGRSRVDRFEKQSLEFNKAVGKVYKQRAKKFKQRIKPINANQPIEQVRDDLRQVLETFWREWRA